MSFYNEFAKYYEYIFPADLSTITFLKNHLKNNGKILDVACGSGEYSIGLTQNNYDVTGIDSEFEMIKSSKNKAKKLHLNIDFKLENMLSLKNSFKENTFSGIFCIGSSLIHLNNYDEIYIALKNMYDLLKDKGVLILEIINYDAISNSNKSSFPLIKNSKEQFEFSREYLIKDKEKLSFNVELKTPNKNLNYSVDLLALSGSKLIEILEIIGFRSIYIYSNFNGSVFLKEKSQNLVLTCKK